MACMRSGRLLALRKLCELGWRRSRLVQWIGRQLQCYRAEVESEGELPHLLQGMGV